MVIMAAPFLIWLRTSIDIINVPAPIPIVTPISSPTTVTQTGVTLSLNSLDPTLLVALIGLIGVIVGALITGVFNIYLHRLEERTRRTEQRQQRQETEAETAMTAMQHARTLTERVATYRKALHADPRIARLQILDMNRPLEVTDIYIHLRLHQDTLPSYELDPYMQDADIMRDPNTLLKAALLRLEQRVSTALTPEEALRRYKHCIIVGDPGAGKTTLLKYLALQSVDQHLADLPDLPIHIELNAFASSGQHNLLSFAATCWEERYGFPKTEALEHMHTQLRDGQALLLLDALDETAAGTTREQAEESYLRTSKAITDAATRYHQTPIVVTARKAGYHQRTRLPGFTELEVLDFRAKEIRQFVERWFACHPDQHKRNNARELNAKLEHNPRIQVLGANPLLLSLIVIVYEDQLDLPERRAELYKQCVDTLLSKWDASRNIRRIRQFKPEHKRQLLEEVAWHFHLQGRRYFSESELLNVIAAFLPAIGLKPEQNRQVLDEIAVENGLLKEQARGWQGFLHLTIQEYFVAQYTVDHHHLDVILENRDNPWWEEVLLLYAGCVPDASYLLQSLFELTSTNPLQDDLFHTNLILAGRCLAAYPTLRQAPLRVKIISHLFQVLKTSPYTLERELVSQTLAEIGGRAVNTQLMDLLVNQQLAVFVRESIVDALGELGEREVAPQLVNLLTNVEAGGELSVHIAGALGKLGERTVAPQLVNLLTDKRLNSSVRQHIADALGELGEREIVPQLVNLLTDEQLNSNVRQHIADALGKLGERAVAPQLVNLLANMQLDASVRQHIADALGKLGERAVAPQLVNLLTNAQLYSNVRYHIADALGKLGERAVAPQLVNLLTDEQLNSVVRWSVALALGELGERAVVPRLMNLLANKQLNEVVSGSVALALGKLGERAVAPQLVNLLTNDLLEIGVRQYIADVLGKLGERSVAPQLVNLLVNMQLDASVRQHIADALGELRESAVAPQLVNLLTKEQLEIALRQSIAHALGELGERAVVPRLMNLLANKQLSDVVRWSIVLVLGELGEREVAFRLVDFLANERLNAIIRMSIASVIGKLGERAVVPRLLNLLANKQLNSIIRSRIAPVVALLADDEQSVSQLANMLFTSDVSDVIYRTLRIVSQKASIRIFIIDQAGSNRIQMIKRSPA